MKLLVFCVLLAWIVFSYLNIYLVVFFCLAYALLYFDGKEHNGDRRMDRIRRFSLWKRLSPVRYIFSDEAQLRLPSLKRLYIMVPGDTIEAVVWAIGLHGGQLDVAFSERLTFVLPPFLFRIPLLRDFLLACGAITYRTGIERPLESLLLEMIQTGRSVCFCPSKFANTILDEGSDVESNNITTFDVPEEIFSFARQEKLQLVPVVVYGERKRYWIFRRWKRVHRFFYKFLEGYAFPMLVVPRFWSYKGPPAPLHVLFGPIIHCDEKYESNKVLREHFRDLVRQSACTGDLKINMQ